MFWDGRCPLRSLVHVIFSSVRWGICPLFYLCEHGFWVFLNPSHSRVQQACSRPRSRPTYQAPTKGRSALNMSERAANTRIRCNINTTYRYYCVYLVINKGPHPNFSSGPWTSSIFVFNTVRNAEMWGLFHNIRSTITKGGKMQAREIPEYIGHVRWCRPMGYSCFV